MNVGTVTGYIYIYMVILHGVLYGSTPPLLPPKQRTTIPEHGLGAHGLWFNSTCLGRRVEGPKSRNVNPFSKSSQFNEQPRTKDRKL